VRTLVSFTVCIVVGAIAGWYVGHNGAKHELSEVVEQMVQTIESSDAAETARDVRAIDLIGAGEAQNAMQVLCTPIANYYCTYEVHRGRADQRLQLHTLIEDLARTNKVVAEEIKRHMDKRKQ
jgi:hypothetical protein